MYSVFEDPLRVKENDRVQDDTMSPDLNPVKYLRDVLEKQDRSIGPTSQLYRT